MRLLFQDQLLPHNEQSAKGREAAKTVHSTQHDFISDSATVIEDQLGDSEGGPEESQYNIIVVQFERQLCFSLR